MIFNPAARGEKAREFRKFLEGIPGDVALKPTQGPGHAVELARAALDEEFQDIVAAGGDGTLNEVLNGIGKADNGFEQARLGVLPLGTVNVFAKELNIPEDAGRAWDTVVAGNDRLIDLPYADTTIEGATERRYFAQLAGAGLDAEAISLVDWESKRRFRQLAYIRAGLRAVMGPQKRVMVRGDSDEAEGELVLIGNGKFYGGRWNVFPNASLTDGKIDVCVFPKVGIWAAVRYWASLLMGNRKVPSWIRYFQSHVVELTSPNGAQFELEGDLAGTLPAKLGVEPERLRVICPP